MLFSLRLGSYGFNASLSKQCDVLILTADRKVSQHNSLSICSYKWNHLASRSFGEDYELSSLMGSKFIQVWPRRPWIQHLNTALIQQSLSEGLENSSSPRQRNKHIPEKRTLKRSRPEVITEDQISGRWRESWARTLHARYAPTSKSGRDFSTEFLLPVSQMKFHSCFCSTCYTLY